MANGTYTKILMFNDFMSVIVGKAVTCNSNVGKDKHYGYNFLLKKIDETASL